MVAGAAKKAAAAAAAGLECPDIEAWVTALAFLRDTV